MINEEYITFLTLNSEETDFLKLHKEGLEKLLKRHGFVWDPSLDREVTTDEEEWYLDHPLTTPMDTRSMEPQELEEVTSRFVSLSPVMPFEFDFKATTEYMDDYDSWIIDQEFELMEISCKILKFYSPLHFFDARRVYVWEMKHEYRAYFC